MMNNAEKYLFSDFTFESYESLLIKAKENYSFRSYTDFRMDENFILWRHDIDFSVHKSLALAKIEAKHGISATYFIHLHSEFYNFFEIEIFQMFQQIISLGHNVGLHFDSHFYNITEEKDLEKYILREKKILEEALNVEVKVFSFHNTNPFVMGCKKHEYAGLINTYSELFQTNVGYCSDSYGVWRFRRLSEVLETRDYKQLQILTHPELWDKDALSPIQRVNKCIEGRAENIKGFYLNFLKNNGREIIDW